MNVNFQTTVLPSRLIGLCTLLWLLVSSFQSQAQTASTPNGNFEVSEVTGCAPFFVRLPITFWEAKVQYQYYFENTLDPATCSGNFQADPFSCTNGSYGNVNTHSYSTPGIYYLIQLNGNAPDGNKVSYVKITVIEPVEPVFNISACTGNQVFVNLDFTQDEYESYTIDFGDGSAPQTVEKSSDPAELSYTYAVPNNYSITVQGLVANQSTNCSPSTKQITTLDSTPTPTLTSLEVVDPNSLNVNYQALDDRVEHTLVISAVDGSQTESITIDATANSTAYNFNNTSFDFATKVYAVRIESNDRCNPAPTASSTAYTVAAQYNAAYDVSDINLDFNFETSPSGLSQVQFYEDTSPQEVFNTETGATQRTLSNCTMVETYYFLAQFGTVTSQSQLLMPDLNGTLTPAAIQNMQGELNNATFELEFDAAPVDVANYTLFKKNPDDSFSEIGTSTTANFTDNNLRSGELELCYKVTYTDDCGNTAELSPEFCFSINIGSINLPNAFSPNGDGANDTFQVGNGVFLGFRMQIFDRWGSLVFSSTDPNQGWDGNFNGQPAQTGAYVYQVSFLDIANTSIQQTGTLLLIR